MLVIFDCDGVLVDSEIISARVDAELLKEQGYEITPAELAHRFAGVTTERLFALVGEELGRVMPDNIIERAEALTDQRLASELESIAGVHEMLDLLDWPRCVCSNSRMERLRISLERTGLYDRFRPYIFSARDVRQGRGKPHPDVFLHAAEAFEEQPGNVVVVEDSVAGVTGAVVAGMRVIGFTGASHSWPGHAEALMDAGAITAIRRLRDVPGTVEALSGWNPQEM